MTKTKKQHYVPRVYLKNFCIAGTSQLNVYDKELKKHRKSNHYDVACENLFYDINWEDMLEEDELKYLKQKGVPFSALNDAQLIENAFAEEVENEFGRIITEALHRAETLTQWEKRNCRIMTEKDKAVFSKCIALQYARSSKIRNSFCEFNKQRDELMKDFGLSDKYLFENDKAHNKMEHIKFILQEDVSNDLTNCIYNLDWTMCINNTNIAIVTSDFPFAHINHIEGTAGHHMNGLGSKGIEVVFPLSPRVMLVMFDGEYHEVMRDYYSMRYYIISDDSVIGRYNEWLAHSAERFVFSSEPISCA